MTYYRSVGSTNIVESYFREKKQLPQIDSCIFSSLALTAGSSTHQNNSKSYKIQQLQQVGSVTSYHSIFQYLFELGLLRHVLANLPKTVIPNRWAKIQEIALNSYIHIDLDLAAALSMACPDLTIVDLTNCPSIDVSPLVSELSSKCSKLTTLTVWI